ncbi:MAG: hypothetical protein AAFZ65_20790, partial [Planctomycetota bacterium]
VVAAPTERIEHGMRGYRVEEVIHGTGQVQPGVTLWISHASSHAGRRNHQCTRTERAEPACGGDRLGGQGL